MKNSLYCTLFIVFVWLFAPLSYGMIDPHGYDTRAPEHFIPEETLLYLRKQPISVLMKQYYIFKKNKTDIELIIKKLDEDYGNYLTIPALGHTKKERLEFSKKNTRKHMKIRRSWAQQEKEEITDTIHTIEWLIEKHYTALLEETTTQLNKYA